MKLPTKVYLVILVTFLIGVLFFISINRTQNLLIAHAEILDNITEIERLEQELDKEILRAGFFLYYDYDVVQQLLRDLHLSVDILESNSYLKNESFASTRKLIFSYHDHLLAKEALILRFGTMNSLVKNSTVHIPTLSSRYIDRFGLEDHDYLLVMSDIVSAVFLASNSLDKDFLDSLRVNVAKLGQFEFTNKDKKSINKVFTAHVNVLLKYLPTYGPTLHEVLNMPTRQSIQAVKKEFRNIADIKANEIRLITAILASVFFISMLIIISLLIIANRESEKLDQAHRSLQELATTDQLTRLGNRFAFDQEHRALASASLLILNIDGFKHINEFYGTEVGDLILKKLAARVRTVISAFPQLMVFRLGGDDFGILIPDGTDISPSQLAGRLTKNIETTPFLYEAHMIPLTFTMGYSAVEPILENADIALKKIKKTRVKYLEYAPGLDGEMKKTDNIRVISEIKQAIACDGVVPYFQPILNNSSGKIERYECLIRLQDSTGNIWLPHQFLGVAQESRLYVSLTRIMIDKCMNIFSHSGMDFSLNLSIEDILDHDVHDYLCDRIKQHPGIGKRMILEILENEKLDDYKTVKNFVQEVAQYGCRIAIDDFGSGYSNLFNVLKLDINNLKIDASLVRDVDSDYNSQVLVSTIVKFAPELGIESTTAEYVHSESVFKKVRELGVTYSQGYYIGKPSPELLDETTSISAI